MPEQITEEPKKFNIRTHYFDARGRTKSKNYYRLHINHGTSLFERPVNSGNLFYENGEQAGRVEVTLNAKGVIVGKKFDEKAAHKAFVAPLTGDEKMHMENESLKQTNAKLLAELEQIKAEREAKQAAKPSNAPSALAAVTEAAGATKETENKPASAKPAQASTKPGTEIL